MMAYDEGKRLLTAIAQFISSHRQEIISSQLKTDAQNLLHSMQSLVSGMEQLAATESVKMNVTKLRNVIREEIRRLYEAELAHHDGDVWYEKSRGGLSREKGEGAPWAGQHDGQVMYFLTKGSAERYAQSGQGKLADNLKEASYGNVNPLSNPQYPDRAKNAQLSTHHPSQEQLQWPWHKQLDGFVADVSDFGKDFPHHPTTGRPLQQRDLKPQTNKEGEVEMWQGVVDGVKLTVFND